MLRFLRALPLRGPKKGKTAEQAPVETTNDVINIFKDRQDPPIMPLSEYPPWLADILKGDRHPIEIALKMYKGEKVELSGRDQVRICRWARKMKINAKNMSLPLKQRYFPNIHEKRIEIGEYDGEDSEEDPDDYLEPYLQLALGNDYKQIVAEQMERLKINLESHKK